MAAAELKTRKRIADLEGMCCESVVFDHHTDPFNGFIRNFACSMLLRFSS